MSLDRAGRRPPKRLALPRPPCHLLRQATLTAILISTAKVGTSIDAFYAALKTIAGPAGAGTGLAVLDKAAAAVNAVKVAQVPAQGAAGGGGAGRRVLGVTAGGRGKCGG